MALIYAQPVPVVYGNKDGKVSDHLKVWISDGKTVVCGVISEGTSRQLQVNWDSPFEGMNADSGRTATVAAYAQEEYGITTVTQLNSTQNFRGVQPHTFPITMDLYALADAYNEVVLPIAHLERMALANLNERLPVEGGDGDDWFQAGDPPGSIQLNVGRNAIYDQCVLESIDTPLGGPVDANGYLLRAQVTLNIQSRHGINKDDAMATFGQER